MMDRETNEERQENELQFLKEVYGATDLRVDDLWKVRFTMHVFILLNGITQ